jgi:hypothetical protein
MKPAWKVFAYLRSHLPLTDKVPPILQVSFFIMGEERPNLPGIKALVETHTRNMDILLIEVEFTPLDIDAFDDM